MPHPALGLTDPTDKTIALVMIARNEARCIGRCLESVAPWVDQMIVLDTGSSDQTIAIARSLGAEVYHFNWCDDFSAARNAALDHSRADWNLVLDADEWLISGGPLLRAVSQQKQDFANQNFADQNFVGAVLVESSFDADQRKDESACCPKQCGSPVRCTNSPSTAIRAASWTSGSAMTATRTSSSGASRAAIRPCCNRR